MTKNINQYKCWMEHNRRYQAGFVKDLVRPTTNY